MGSNDPKSDDAKKDCEPKDQKDAPPADTKLAPVKKHIGEGDKNLDQRGAWFQRRTSKDDPTG